MRSTFGFIVVAPVLALLTGETVQRDLDSVPRYGG